MLFYLLSSIHHQRAITNILHKYTTFQIYIVKTLLKELLKLCEWIPNNISKHIAKLFSINKNTLSLLLHIE